MVELPAGPLHRIALELFLLCFGPKAQHTRNALVIEMRAFFQLATHVYEVRPRKDRRGSDLISDALPFGRLWYGGPNAVSNAIGYASQYSRSHDAVIRVYDEAGKVIETPEQAGEIGKRYRRGNKKPPRDEGT